MHCRKRSTVVIPKITPAMKTDASAVWHLYPNCKHTVKAMKAFSPIYGAMAKGRLAYNPMSRQPNTAASAVATKLGPAGMPALRRIAGFTTSMDDLVAKGVQAANPSRDK